MPAKEAKPTTDKAWDLIRKATISFRGKPVGTIAANDPELPALNYRQVFTRDFAVSAAALLLRGEYATVRNFLVCMLAVQGADRHMDCFRPGPGQLPASFTLDAKDDEEVLVADFGERSIGHVAPVDSGFWWLLILCQYTRATGDHSLAGSEEFQKGIKLVINLALETRYDMLPTLLVPDGSFTIDRRMGVYGYPLELQALFLAGLRAAEELLPPGDDYQKQVQARLGQLTYHLRRFYWLDMHRLNRIHRYSTEEYGLEVPNEFNIHPRSIPEWIYDWLPDNGGFFAGNLGPERLDFRFFTQGNLLAILTSLADSDQRESIFTLIDERWDDLVGQMPMKICYPPLKGQDWQTLTGADPKNIAWSYHNGGSWPFLLWLLTAAALKAGRTDLAERALHLAERRLEQDEWPEYYDGPAGRLVGRRARRYQTWTIAAFLVARDLLSSPGRFPLFTFDSEIDAVACTPSEPVTMGHAPASMQASDFLKGLEQE